MLTNIFVLAGAGMTLVDNFTIFLVGRFLYGMACGGFSVFCPKYISEVAPVELKGPAGGLTQICITFGIIVPFSIGLAYPSTQDNDTNTQEINILFIIPIILSGLQVILLFTVFRYDTPIMIKQKGEYEKLKNFMSNIYYP